MKHNGYSTPIVGQQRTALPGEDNYGFIDRFTAAHAAFGILAGLGRLPAWATLASGLFFDLVIERQFKDKWPELWPNPTQDTWQNIAGDTVAMMLGWKVAKMLPEGKTPLHTTIKSRTSTVRASTNERQPLDHETSTFRSSKDAP